MLQLRLVQDLNGPIWRCRSRQLWKWRNTVSGADKAFKMAVMKIRNSIAYHYYQPKKLVQGYKKHFLESPRSEDNALAYSSFGKNMEESRFILPMQLTNEPASTNAACRNTPIDPIDREACGGLTTCASAAAR